MSLPKDFISTTVGKKIIMAATGLVLLLFVAGHMAGNLKMFAGIDAASGKYKLDLYAELLRSIGADFIGHETFLWGVRAVLLLCLVLHVSAALQLAALNARAKPINPQRQWYGASNPASRTMLYGGLFLLCFIVFHILHFTTGHLHFRGFVHGAVYHNVFQGFQSAAVAAFYVLAMACLALHLYHGTWSLFQTLGIDSPAWNGGLRTIAKVLAVLLFVGFSAVPVAASLDLLPSPIAPSVHEAR